MAELEEKKSDLQNKIDERKTFEVYVAILEKAIELMGKFYFKCLFLFNIFNFIFVVLKNSVAMHKNLMIFQLSKKKKRAFKK